MKKRNLLLACLTIAPLSALGCDENLDTKCTSEKSVCISSNRLAECISGQEVIRDCPSGSVCQEDRCAIQETCSPSEPSSCFGSEQVKQCVEGAYTLTPCGLNQACQNGACIPQTGNNECLAGQTKCEGNTLSSCQDGLWKNDACPTNQACLSGACAETCHNTGSVKCDGLDVLACSADLFWVKSTTCTTGCQNGACTTTECTASGFVPYCLNATTLASACSAAGTLTKTTCPNGCQNNACVTTTPECSQAGFTPYCINTTTLASACSAAGVLTKTTCPNGCQNDACVNTAPECNPAGFTPYCINTTTLASACSAAGTLTRTTCPSGCAAGKCQTDTPEVGSSCSSSFVDSCYNNVMYYCSNGRVEASNCSMFALLGMNLTCIPLKDGASTCGESDVSDKCSADGSTYFITDATGNNTFCTTFLMIGTATYGLCQLVDGKMYGVLSAAFSICNGNDRVYCSGAAIQKQFCSRGCSYNATSATATCM